MTETLAVPSNREDVSVPPQASCHPMNDCSSLLLELHIVEEAAVSRSTSSETSQSSSSTVRSSSHPVSCVHDSQNTVVRISSPVPAVEVKDLTSVTVPEVIRSSNPVMNVKTSSASVERKSITAPMSISHITAMKNSIPEVNAKSPVPDPGITITSPVPAFTTPPPAPPVSRLTLTPKTSKKNLDMNPVCPKPQLLEDKPLVSSDSIRLDGEKQSFMVLENLENEGLFSEASDVSLDLPLLQPSAVERLSASGQV